LKAFERFYYSFSPAVASAVALSQPMAAIVRLILYPLLSILRASSAAFHVFDFAPEVGTVVAGVFSSALLGVTYAAPSALGIQYLLKRRRWVNRSVSFSLIGLYREERNQPLAGVSQ